MPWKTWPETLPCVVTVRGMRLNAGVRTDTLRTALTRIARHDEEQAQLSPAEREANREALREFGQKMGFPVPNENNGRKVFICDGCQMFYPDPVVCDCNAGTTFTEGYIVVKRPEETGNEHHASPL